MDSDKLLIRRWISYKSLTPHFSHFLSLSLSESFTLFQNLSFPHFQNHSHILIIYTNQLLETISMIMNFTYLLLLLLLTLSLDKKPLVKIHPIIYLECVFKPDQRVTNDFLLSCSTIFFLKGRHCWSRIVLILSFLFRIWDNVIMVSSRIRSFNGKNKWYRWDRTKKCIKRERERERKEHFENFVSRKHYIERLKDYLFEQRMNQD